MKKFSSSKENTKDSIIKWEEPIIGQESVWMFSKEDTGIVAR